MDRAAVVTFSNQLREARETALRDAEAFDGIVHVIERLGSFLRGRLTHLGDYGDCVQGCAAASALAERIPVQYRTFHVSFSRLYELVRQGRNDALHQGSFARRLTGHAMELSLILEDALRQKISSPIVGDYMVRDPVCAELWQPVSFIRQRMLANSFSFLPIRSDGEWCLISDLDITKYLGTEGNERGKRLAQRLDGTDLQLRPAQLCSVDTPIAAALTLIADDQRPLLVCPTGEDRQTLIGIVTPFDLL